MKRVLITGAAGRIGTVLRRGLRESIPILRLTDVIPLGEARDGEEIARVDLRDYPSVEAVMHEVDAVIHLGGIPDETHFQSILETNILGTYNVFEAAKNQGVKRVIFASSIHSVGFYPREQKIGPDVPVRPDTYYGVSKTFGESLGSLYADKFGLEVVSVRICSFEERPRNRRHLSTWLSHRDAVQLFSVLLQAKQVHYSIVYGVSGNSRSWFDNSHAEALGYRPIDNAETYCEEVIGMTSAATDQDGLAEKLMGGEFVLRDYGLRKPTRH
ncbi:NAD-dependent epimerase/dehydratase family protein [Brevibacillus sp. H7]|uniref:NAD-dependent epimerase/dehydratase family protein n=1 Tax=Brevibacillus sp. H7 TaxID=3349138 RepID=UPI0038039DEC